MQRDELRDKFVGCVVGAAIGDALGMPNEDVPARKAQTYYAGPIRDFLSPHQETPCRNLREAQYTDDTQLMLALAQALVEGEGFEPPRFVDKLIAWYKIESHEKRYRGKTTIAAVEKLMKGAKWEQSGIDHAGCGGATRAVPVGLFFAHDLHRACECAALQCQVTHNNAIAIDGARCVAATVARLVNGQIISINELRELVGTSQFRDKLTDIERALHKQLDLSAAIETLGNSSLATDVVGMALFVVLSAPTDFEKAALLAANATGEGGGDTDSIAFLVGAFAGAYGGLRAIKHGWVERVESTQVLQDMGERIYVAACRAAGRA